MDLQILNEWNKLMITAEVSITELAIKSIEQDTISFTVEDLHAAAKLADFLQASDAPWSVMITKHPRNRLLCVRMAMTFTAVETVS